MVDFQSRDTRRGSVGNEADDEEPEDADGDEETAPDETPQAEVAEEEPPTADANGATDVPTDSLGVGLVTVTSNGSAEDDPAGEAVTSAVEPADIVVSTREVIEPGYDRVQSTVTTLAKRDDVDLVVTVGATEAGPDDVVPEAVEPLLDRSLPGFGELLRLLAHDEVGSGILTMRPLAGMLNATPVFCLPGEAWAARLGAEEIVVPEAERVVGQATEDEDDEEG